MRLKIETNETTKEKIGSALKGSFDARKDHMTREALRAGTSVGDEDRDFATGMNVARTYGMPDKSVEKRTECSKNRNGCNKTGIEDDSAFVFAGDHYISYCSVPD